MTRVMTALKHWGVFVALLWVAAQPAWGDPFRFWQRLCVEGSSEAIDGLKRLLQKGPGASAGAEAEAAAASAAEQIRRELARLRPSDIQNDPRLAAVLRKELGELATADATQLLEFATQRAEQRKTVEIRRGIRDRLFGVLRQDLQARPTVVSWLGELKERKWSSELEWALLKDLNRARDWQITELLRDGQVEVRYWPERLRQMMRESEILFRESKGDALFFWSRPWLELPENALVRQRLEDFLSGRIGSRIAGLRIDGKTAQQLIIELEELRPELLRLDNGNCIPLENPACIWFFVDEDGVFVKVKPNTNRAATYRPEPHASKGVFKSRVQTAAETGFENEAFKIADRYTVMPRTARPDDGFRQDFEALGVDPAIAKAFGMNAVHKSFRVR